MNNTRIWKLLIGSALAIAGIVAVAQPAAAVTQIFSPAYSTKTACVSAQTRHPNVAAQCFLYAADGKWHFTYTIKGYM